MGAVTNACRGLMVSGCLAVSLQAQDTGQYPQVPPWTDWYPGAESLQGSLNGEVRGPPKGTPFGSDPSTNPYTGEPQFNGHEKVAGALDAIKACLQAEGGGGGGAGAVETPWSAAGPELTAMLAEGRLVHESNHSLYKGKWTTVVAVTWSDGGSFVGINVHSLGKQNLASVMGTLLHEWFHSKTAASGEDGHPEAAKGAAALMCQARTCLNGQGISDADIHEALETQNADSMKQAAEPAAGGSGQSYPCVTCEAVGFECEDCPANEDVSPACEEGTTITPVDPAAEDDSTSPGLVDGLGRVVQGRLIETEQIWDGYRVRLISVPTVDPASSFFASIAVEVALLDPWEQTYHESFQYLLAVPLGGVITCLAPVGERVAIFTRDPVAGITRTLEWLPGDLLLPGDDDFLLHPDPAQGDLGVVLHSDWIDPGPVTPVGLTALLTDLGTWTLDPSTWERTLFAEARFVPGFGQFHQIRAVTSYHVPEVPRINGSAPGVTYVAGLAVEPVLVLALVEDLPGYFATEDLARPIWALLDDNGDFQADGGVLVPGF